MQLLLIIKQIYLSYGFSYVVSLYKVWLVVWLMTKQQNMESMSKNI